MTEDCCCDPPWEFNYKAPPVDECNDAACDETNCISFGEIDSCVHCTEAPRRYTVDFGIPPCFNCCENAAGSHTLTYDAGCGWVSETFDCGGDTYRWELTIDATNSDLTLAKIAGPGVPIDVVYEKADPWNCLCVNEMLLDTEVNCGNARGVVCVVPQEDVLSGNCGVCTGQFPQCWEIILSGFASNVCPHCEDINGTYIVERNVDETGCGGVTPCTAKIPLADICAGTGFGVAPRNWILILSFAGTGLFVQVVGTFSPCDAANSEYRAAWPTPDCFDENVDTSLSALGQTNPCDFTAATIVIRPVDCEA